MINKFYDDITCQAVYQFETGYLNADSQRSNHLVNFGVVDNSIDFHEGLSSAQLNGAQYLSISDTSLINSFPLKYIYDVVDRQNTLSIISVAFWVKLSNSIGIQAIVAKHNESDDRRCFMVYADSGILKVAWGYNDGVLQKIISSSTTLEVDKWYHIGVSCTSSELICQIYIYDWQAQAAICNLMYENISSVMTTCTADFTVGSDHSGNYKISALLDELVVFNTFKKPNEYDKIRQGQYAGPLGNSMVDDPDCVSWYDFEPGQFLDDWVGSGNSLTNVKTVTESTSTFKVNKQSAYFNSANQEYAYRLDADLSSTFPFKVGDSNKRATFVFWVRLDTYSSGGVICKSSNVNGKRSFAIQFGGQNLQVLWGGPNGNSFETFSTLSFVLHRWYYVAIAVDGIQKILTVRIWDDILKTVTYYHVYHPLNTLFVGTGPFSIGHHDGSYSYFSGWLDELVVYNNTKSMIETDLMRQGLYHRRLLFACDESCGVTPSFVLQDLIKTFSVGAQSCYGPTQAIQTQAHGVMVMIQASNRYTSNNFLPDPDCVSSYSFESGSGFLKDSKGGNDLTDHGTIDPVQ